MKQKSSDTESKYQEEINVLQSQTKGALMDATIKAESKRLKEESEKLKVLLTHKDAMLNSEIKKSQRLLMEIEAIKGDILNEYKEIETLKKAVTPTHAKDALSFTSPIKSMAQRIYRPRVDEFVIEKKKQTTNKSYFQKTILMTEEEGDPYRK